MLKYRLQRVVSVQDWDKLVEKVYGRPYSFQQQNGCQSRGIVELEVPNGEDNDEEMNDQIPMKINGEIMGVKLATWLAADPKEYENIFWERNFYPDLYTLADDLFKKGHIEAGEYTINIDW